MDVTKEPASILIVDDDEIILIALAETISRQDYRIVKVNHAFKALEHVQREKFAVVISDQRMPDMKGLEFLAKVKNIQPNASRILITGVLTLKTIIDAVNKGEIFRFLAKPWIREELLATIDNAVQRFNLLEINAKLYTDTLKLNERIAQTNADLQHKIREISAQKKALDDLNRVFAKNFEHSLELCYRIINAYHPLLGQETRTIADLCNILIVNSDLAPDDEYVLKVSAWMQNLGLIGISRDLFTKARQHPDTLTTAEKEIIHNHPIYGQTLASFVDNLPSVGVTIRAHHERWDGKGYPDGLSGENIPHPARYLAIIVHFVECGLPREEAIERILQLSGTAFDPEAVQTFLKATQLIKLPPKVKEVLLADLKPGMVLAKGISSPTGILLIPDGIALNDEMLMRIKDRNIAGAINQRLLVFN